MREILDLLQNLLLGLLMWLGVGFVLFFIFVICNPIAWIGMLIVTLFWKVVGG